LEAAPVAPVEYFLDTDCGIENITHIRELSPLN